MHSPSLQHLDILVQLCIYVCSTVTWDLCYHFVPELANAAIGSVDFIFYGYCGSSYADDPDTMCSTGGYFIMLGQNQGAVASKSFLSKNPALSSTEAEYIALSECAKECAWIKQFIGEIQVFNSTSFEMREESSPCINALRIYYHFVRELIKRRWCSVVKISTSDQTGDLSTKVLPPKTVLRHASNALGHIQGGSRV